MNAPDQLVVDRDHRDAMCDVHDINNPTDKPSGLCEPHRALVGLAA